MDIDYYRLAYNTFFHNCRRFGILEHDIPDAKTEKVESLNLIIPGFSKAVVFFQIASRSELKEFLDKSLKVHNLEDFYTRFENAMKKVFPERFVLIKDLPRGILMEDFSEGSVAKDTSEDTTETSLSEDNTEEDISEGSKKEILPEDTNKENLPEDDEQEDNKIKPEDVPGVIALSLAICTEVILYEYDYNRKYMEYVPDMWMKYFNENLKDLCFEAGCTEDHLRAYSESISCSDRILNKFIAEYKYEYDQIEDKFREFIEANCGAESPEESPEGCKCMPQKGLSFRKLKNQFGAIVDYCKCTKGNTGEEIPLLDDYSPCTSSSTSS